MSEMDISKIQKLNELLGNKGKVYYDFRNEKVNLVLWDLTPEQAEKILNEIIVVGVEKAKKMILSIGGGENV